MAFTRITDPTNNIASLANRPVEAPATLKQKFDQIGEDLKDYTNNVLIAELESIVDSDSGADNIGATPLTGGTANTVQGILEELKTEIDLDDGNNVKLTGNQTVNDVKTFTSSPIVPTPTTDMQTSTKKYVDDTTAAVVLGQIPDGSLTDVKLSNVAGQIKDQVSILNGLKTVLGTGTIPTTGWVVATGDYKFKLDYPIVGVTTADWVDVEVERDSIADASKAGISAVVEYNGGITFYGQSVPLVTIPISYRITKGR